MYYSGSTIKFRSGRLWNDLNSPGLLGERVGEGCEIEQLVFEICSRQERAFFLG